MFRSFPFAAAVKLKNSQQDILFEESVMIDADKAKSEADGQWSVSLSYKLPEYMRSGRMKLSFESVALFITAGGLPVMDLNYKSKPLAAKALTSQIKKTSAGPRLFVNDKIVYPVWGWICASQRFGDAPLNLLTVSDLGNWWAGIDKYAFYLIDAEAEKVHRANPDAGFMMDIQLYPPADWKEKYKDELALGNDGIPVKYYKTACSYSSEIARRDMGNALKRVN